MTDNKSKHRPRVRDGNFVNPFRPGAGHPPPHLAGREAEQADFKRSLQQRPILKNVILTGLRGVGKTVLLEAFRPIAIEERWGWVGTDLSESASISEEHMAVRILTDLSVFASGLSIQAKARAPAGFAQQPREVRESLNHHVLLRLYNETPGLVADKLKYVLERVWTAMESHNQRGIVFAYDEAQNLADHVNKDQRPLSLLLDVFQSVQRKGIRFILVLTGLPTLFSRLVEARTYSERMFHVTTLSHLSKEASREAITVPIKKTPCPFSLTNRSIETIIEITGGYPYFIQFVCKEVYDIWLQGEDREVPIDEVLAKLDADFFSGRWTNATDRQRDLLRVAAQLPHPDNGFTLLEIVTLAAKMLERPFKASHVNRMLADLQEGGLVYKLRHGRYMFAVPLLGRFIIRQAAREQELK